MKWDEEAEAFVVEEGAAKDEFVGEHLICMNVAYFNETYRDEYEDCFTLTIKANATVVENEEQAVFNDTAWVPPEKIEPKQPPVNQF